MNTLPPRPNSRLILWLITLLPILLKTPAVAQDSTVTSQNSTDAADRIAVFETKVRPLLTERCARCHNADNMTSGIRVDQISGIPEDRHLALLEDIREQIDSAAMPPENEPGLTAEQRTTITHWIDSAVRAAQEQGAQKNGAMRRPVCQFRQL